MQTVGLKFKSEILTLLAVFFSATLFAQSGKIADTELKKNAAPLNNSLSFISQLEPLTFEYNKEEFGKLNLPAGRQYGFLAEDVQRVLPGIVKNETKRVPAGKNAFKNASVSTVDLESLIPILVGSIKEQQAEIERLRQEVQSLKSMTAR